MGPRDLRIYWGNGDSPELPRQNHVIINVISHSQIRTDCRPVCVNVQNDIQQTWILYVDILRGTPTPTPKRFRPKCQPKVKQWMPSSQHHPGHEQRKDARRHSVHNPAPQKFKQSHMLYKLMARDALGDNRLSWGSQIGPASGVSKQNNY